MNRYKTAIFGAAFVVAGTAAGSSSALAQTFENYHCADGTHFIVGFFKYDSRAHMQIGGKACGLVRLALFGRWRDLAVHKGPRDGQVRQATCDGV
jgi:hypothetical protein